MRPDDFDWFGEWGKVQRGPCRIPGDLVSGERPFSRKRETPASLRKIRVFDEWPYIYVLDGKKKKKYQIFPYPHVVKFFARPSSPVPKRPAIVRRRLHAWRAGLNKVPEIDCRDVLADYVLYAYDNHILLFTILYILLANSLKTKWRL